MLIVDENLEYMLKLASEENIFEVQVAVLKFLGYTVLSTKNLFREIMNRYSLASLGSIAPSR